MEKIVDFLEKIYDYLLSTKITNIVEISVPLIVILLGTAYPIIINNISKIGDKYNSKYLLSLFNNEFCQKKRLCNKNIFELILISSLISLFFHVVKFQPFFNWNHPFINNSAKIITILLTIILIIIFFMWITEVRNYIDSIDNLLAYVIKKHKKTKKDSIKKYL